MTKYIWSYEDEDGKVYTGNVYGSDVEMFYRLKRNGYVGHGSDYEDAFIKAMWALDDLNVVYDSTCIRLTKAI